MTQQLLTFLFTDLAESTSLWEQFAEEMRPAMARHDAILKEIVKSHQGRIVKMTGDGLHAAFESPSDGVAAALAGQQAIATETWPSALAPLRVRMGLHTGESQERDGDYYGSEVNRAARVMSVGAGGQILISEVTAALVGAHLPRNATLTDLGSHRLKGLSVPEKMFQLNHPDLPDEFPPLACLDTFQHNLPIQLTSFIGREQEMEKARQSLAETRLLTLLGPGGTGKTRLALQVAADLVEQFPDGVWFVELAPLTDPDLIAQRVATTLNVQEQSGRPLLDTLTNYLRRRTVLLLLDNVEHLVHESAELAEHLLLNCPSVKLLVTGREALFIGGETAMQIPSLSLPAKDSPTQDVIAKSEAVQLFLARAQAARTDFDITPDNATTLANIVRRLDGIPLALELAAVRLRAMSIEQIAQRLDDRFRLLTGGRRTALPRQQTLQALIDWSWNLLEEKEQILLRRLSVFSGGWALDAAQATASDTNLDEFDILDLLDQLISKSLVNVDHLSHDDVRYAMLESIRQYAQDRLFDSGEGEALRTRHAEYFTAYSAKMSNVLQGPEMLAWLDRFLRETDNARVAREWALESRLDLALRMTETSVLVQRYWYFFSDGRRWLREVVQKTRNHPAVKTEMAYRRGLACAIISLGAATMGQGDSSNAIAILQEGIALAEAAGVAEHQAFGLNMLVISMLQLGEFQSAEEVGMASLTISREHGLDFQRMMTLGSFIPILAFQGKHEQAHTHTQEAIQLAKRFHNPWTNAMSKQMKGWSERGKQHWEEAEAAFSEASRLFDAIRDTAFSFISRSEAGHMKRKLGDYAGAEELYRTTILFFREASGKSAVIHQLECFGFIALYQEQSERGATLLGAAQALRESEQSTRLPPEQIEFDEALTQLVTGMGAETRDRFMAEGAAMSLDQAVAFALEHHNR